MDNQQQTTKSNWRKTPWGILLILVLWPIFLTYWIWKRDWNEKIKVGLIAFIWFFVLTVIFAYGFYQAGYNTEKKTIMQKNIHVLNISPTSSPTLTVSVTQSLIISLIPTPTINLLTVPSIIPSPSVTLTITPIATVPVVEIPKYQIIFSEDIGAGENYMILIPPEKSSVDYAKNVALDVKSKCNKPCNVDVYDDQKALKLQMTYDKMSSSFNTTQAQFDEWNRNNYVYVADHYVGMIGFDTEEFSEYPFKDSKYYELK